MLYEITFQTVNVARWKMTEIKNNILSVGKI